jgi:hypothetical protein
MRDLRLHSEYKTLPLEVANTGFMLDRLGKDCAPLQFLRELTQNAIEAILRQPESAGKSYGMSIGSPMIWTMACTSSVSWITVTA